MHQSGLRKEAEGLEKIAVARKWFVEARTAKAAAAVSLVVGLGLAGCGSSSESAKGTTPSEYSEQSGGADSAAPSKSVSSSDSAAPSESAVPSETSAGTQPGTSSSKPQKSTNKPEKSASKPKVNRKKFGANTVVMEGTVRIMSNRELIDGPMKKDLNGWVPVEADQMTDRYPILVLDKPTKLTGHQADPEPRTETVKYVSLGHSSPEWANLNVWKRYDGKRVVVVANQDDFGWPSDVSMPLGWLRFAGHETADIIVR
ncbi:hypothetical protein CAY35_00120 [Pseudoglutamicibacter cumminsii]|uniref:YkuD domain-containing protein n=1 Tax=Pseudoglutamicibacter cumminsii TaxID=156979 RepID=A0ABX5L7Z8_9MICC|nr:hypothetical protein CAY35_00120 [Pseudoglutamicibacter cumminsii]